MREILFRGKRQDNGEWVEGCYCKYPHQFSGFLKDCIFTSWYDAKLVSSVESGTCIAYPVDPETVGQYTGSIDENRTKIFEGDIVQAFTRYGTKHIYPIEYRDGTFWFGNWNWIEFLDRFQFREVIGNIYDNPGLLGEPMKPASKKCCTERSCTCNGKF